MSLDPELLKQLIETFKSELDEQSQIIIDGLLLLEKNNLSDEERNKRVESIFRAAHNVKGASRSLGINDVAQISHAIETLFAFIKKDLTIVPREIIDRCLDAVDKMRSAMESFVLHKPLSFELNELLNHLKTDEYMHPVEKNIPKIEAPVVEAKPINEATRTETIRVSIEQIDRISALMEEMQVNKIAIDDHYTDLSQLYNKSKQLGQTWSKLFSSIQSIDTKSDENFQRNFNTSADYIYESQNSIDQMYKNMRGHVNELSTLFNTLQEEIRMLRLVPANHLFSTFPRYVRDLAHENNKEIDLTITGDNIKMDKMVLDGIKDPIIHILRNAVDHGIENKVTREAKGKPPIGHIHINLVEDENRVLIYIEDDGAGIDIKRIGETILNKSLISQSEYEKLNDDELLDYIYHPGFSTKEIITDISGRGVGLNVVKSNLELLKGQVSVKTNLEKGTTFCLSVPFTLTSERGLMIKCGGEIFVVPTNFVQRVLLIKPTDIIEVQGSQAIMLDEHPIALHSLAEILGLSKKDISAKNDLSIIVLQKNSQHRVSFIIDEVLGEREMIIKPLQYPFTSLPCVGGGTLSGSNRIIIVLNSNELIARALQNVKYTPISISTKMTEAPKRPHILVVDDSITTRTLEKNVLESKNYQVTVAVNGQEAWELLQKQKFSLLITDVTMPIMDGFTLTEQVKKNENTNYLPVIIVTSLGSDAEKKRGIEVGADAYIVKNEFESGALLEIVSQLV